jgi:hypothetical protein
LWKTVLQQSSRARQWLIVSEVIVLLPHTTSFDLFSLSLIHACGFFLKQVLVEFVRRFSFIICLSCTTCHS